MPVEVRRQLGIQIGDLLEVEVIPEEGKIELRRPRPTGAGALEGSLKEYGRDRPFPSEGSIAEALRRGLADRG